MAKFVQIQSIGCNLARMKRQVLVWGGAASLWSTCLGQITHLGWEADTCFYANPDPAGGFDPGNALPGNTTYRLYAHFVHPGDRLQAVYALGLGSTVTEPWTLDAPCGCVEHPFGSSIGAGTNAVLLDAFPDLAYDSYYTLDGNPGTTIAGGIPVLGGAPDLPEVCNTVLADAAMYVLGGVPAGSDLRVLIGQISTCGPLTLAACFQVQQVNGTLQNWCTSDAPNVPLTIDPPCAPWAADNAVLSANSGVNPVAVEIPWAAAWPVEVTLFDAATNAAAGVFMANPSFSPPPGTYYAALKDGHTCRDTTGVFCVPPPFYACDGACLDDADGDGVCDPLEVPGCLDESACNFEPEATDLVPCTFAEPGYDCSGDCLADGDGDGVCDPFEIPGCTSPYACNFNPEATDDDGSCAFLPTFSIAGPSLAFTDAITAYSYPAAPSSACAWTVDGGTVVGGQGTANIEVIWEAPGMFEVVVAEVADTCTSAPVSLLVEVGANSTPSLPLVSFEIQGQTFRAFEPGSLRCFDLQGRLILNHMLAPNQALVLPHRTLAVFENASGRIQHIRVPIP